MRAKFTEADARKLGLLKTGKTVVIGGLTKAQKRAQKLTEQAAFIGACIRAGLPMPSPEFKFHHSRRWRFDWAWPDAYERVYRELIALEIQGGLYTQGRHTQGSALEKEYEKLNEAQLAGWKVFLVTPKQVASGHAFELVRRALGLGG